MKKVFLITTSILLFTSLQSNAQWFVNKIKGNGTLTTKTRTVSTYNKISVSGPFNVTLIPVVKSVPSALLVTAL